MKFLLLTVVAFLFSSELAAECAPTACGGVNVSRLYVNTSGVIYVGTSGDETLLNCPAVSGVYTTLDITRPGGDAVYSTILAAQSLGKKVTIRISENSPGCEILYVLSDAS